MAITKLSDIIVPEVFFGYVQEQSTKKNALVNSGIVPTDPMIVSGLSGGGKTFNVPGFQHIADTSNDYNVSSDDPQSAATANKIQTTQQIASRLERNAVWGGADLAAQLAGADPMAAAANMVGGYQAHQRQKTLVNMMTGVFDSADMSNAVNDIAVEDGDNATAGNLISNDAIIETLTPFDDMQGTSNVLAVHGDIYRALQKNNLITFEPSSAQNIGFGTYLGFTLLVDSSVPKVAGGVTGYKYTSYVIKPGAVGFGNAAPRVPVEVDREPLEGDGGGVEYLIVRDTYTFHPYGMKWTGSPAGVTPNNSELAAGSNWTRVYNQKNVGLAALVTNG